MAKNGLQGFLVCASYPRVASACGGLTLGYPVVPLQGTASVVSLLGMDGGHPTTQRSPAKLFSKSLKMPKPSPTNSTAPSHASAAPTHESARRRTNGVFLRTAVTARDRRPFRFHPTPSGKTANSKIATRVAPKKNEFEKQTHAKVTLKCRNLTQTVSLLYRRIPTTARLQPATCHARPGLAGVTLWVDPT